MISSAQVEARDHRDFVLRNLTMAGVRWVLAEGYITIWKRLHRAEEALIDAEPRTDVVADALYDEWRLEGSTMDHCDLLSDQLRRARQYLQSLSRPQAAVASGPQVGPQEAPVPRGHPFASESEARAVVRSVRRALNEFRDERWNGIIRARNLLMGTMLLTQLFAFALLALAVLQRAPGSAVAAAIVFFLVGAVVGLFNRLSRQAASGTTVDDYSLAGARILVTPVFSGLAAIGGVVLTGTLTMSGLTGLVQPVGASNAVAPVALPVLADIFNLDRFRIGLVIAALFGWTPSLLASRLQQLTDRYKRDLESTEPSGSGPGSPQPNIS